MLKRYLILSFQLLLAVFAMAQTGTIRGRVTTTDGQGAADVTIGLKGTSRMTAVNTEGNYEIKGIVPGIYHLVVSFTGLQSQEKEVTVQANNATIVNFVLEVSNSELHEVLVAGSKKMQDITRPSSSLRLTAPLMEVPQNITVTDQTTIRNIGALSLADIMRTSSGITPAGDKQDVVFNIRGTQVVTNILRNGIGSGYWYNQEPDAAMIEKVEFVKGPAGFMISNSEPGGLINVVTKQPTHTRITRAEMGTGSFKLFRTAVDLGGELSKNHKLTYRMNAGIQRQADFYVYNRFRKNFAALALKYEFNSRTAITAEYNHVASRQNSNGQILPTINGQFFVLPDNFGTIDPNVTGPKASDEYLRLQFSHRFSPKWHVQVQAATVNGYFGGTQMANDGVSPTYDTLYRYTLQSDWRNRLRNVQAFLDGTLATGRHITHQVLGGLEYADLRLHNSGSNTYGDRSRFYLLPDRPAYGIPMDSLQQTDLNSFDERYSNKYAALYVQDHIKFFNKLIVTLAGRYTYSETYTNYSDPETVTVKKFVPRLGLTYLFNDQLSAYVIYDGAFVPQSGRSFGGSTFEPLTGQNREIGLKGRFFHRFNASLAVYDIIKNNALTADPEHQDYLVQTGRLSSGGVEFDLSGQVLPNLNLFANYAYNDARIVKDNNPALVGLVNAGAIRHSVNLFGRYTTGSLSFGGGAAYAGPVSGGLNQNDNTFAGYLPSRLLFEAAVGYIFRKLSVNLNAYNLSNKRYATAGYRLAGNDWMYSPGLPRHFRLSVVLNLGG